eukprot:2620-Heterococcus_DN1.PRE.4
MSKCKMHACTDTYITCVESNCELHSRQKGSIIQLITCKAYSSRLPSALLTTIMSATSTIPFLEP